VAGLGPTGGLLAPVRAIEAASHSIVLFAVVVKKSIRLEAWLAYDLDLLAV